MIKASELRIGNRVRYTDSKEETVIYQLEHRFRETYRINDINDNQNIEPIPLTEEWILKFGFEKEDENTNEYTIKGSVFTLLKLRIGIDGRERFALLSHDFNPKLDYVHELMNLFYTLTGQELKTNK